jgi:hypothetical protein
MGDVAQRVSTQALPDWMVPLAAQAVPDLGKVRKSTSEEARRVLGWEPRSKEDAIIATAESLVRLGLLGDLGKVG